jgi:hypothetical protein
MADDVETLIRQQQRNSLVHALDSAVQVGDINAARNATRQLSELAITEAKKTTPAFTNTDIRDVLKTKAPWFGVDPRRSAKAVEFGKNMEPTAFKSAEEFADELIKAVEDEFDPKDEEEEEANDDPEDEPKKAARKKTDAPSDNAARAIPRRSSSGPWLKLSDAPKETADIIRASADKFTRNATKEQRQKYIETALSTAYAADQRTKGKK